MIGDRIRYAITNALRGPASLQRMQETMLSLYLGHNRIIAWRDGLPIRSLMAPPEHSGPFVTSGSLLLNSMRYGIPYPGSVTVDIAGECNCRCSHCIASFVPGSNLPADTWTRVFRECADLGVFLVVMEGGEPLLNQDLGAIIRSVDTDRCIVVVFTNAYHLQERARELRRCGLERIFVSLDFDDQRHDENRRCPGLFERALRGLEAARSEGLLVGISTFVTPERLYNGALDGVASLSRRLKVHELFVLDGIPAGCLSDREDLRHPDKAYTRDLRGWAQAWWSDKGAPGLWWYGHVSSYQACGCAAGFSTFHISNNGDLRPCLAIKGAVGSVLDDEVRTLWFRLQALSAATRKRSGYACWLRCPGCLEEAGLGRTAGP